jgi:hypothetical protein
MPNTFELIASSTVGSGGAASIVFSSIASTYTDLVVKVSGRTTRTAAGSDWVKISFNGVTTNLSMRSLFGGGTSVGSYTDTSIYSSTNSDSQTATTFGSTEFYIPNYAGSTNKSVSADGVSEINSSTNNDMTLVAGLWSSTAAINQITLTPYTGPNFMQHTTAYLYGVKNA